MAKPVVVVDYGVGNLFSVARALEACGASPKLSSSPDEIADAERVVLPGVGAFGDCMRELRERGLVEPVKAYAETGRPMIGLCVGMQMMLSGSEEFGAHDGLNLIPGKVVKLDPKDEAGAALKVPHIGWNALQPDSAWSGTVLSELKPGEQVYFVHSFAPVTDDPSHSLAHCRYGTSRVTAVVRRDNLSGCQFHPEKSGPAGLAILSRFVNR